MEHIGVVRGLLAYLSFVGTPETCGSLRNWLRAGVGGSSSGERREATTPQLLERRDATNEFGYGSFRRRQGLCVTFKVTQTAFPRVLPPQTRALRNFQSYANGFLEGLSAAGKGFA